MRTRGLALAAALTLYAGVRAAGVDAPDASIRLDAIVTDGRERAIRDLKPSDFEVIDAGENIPVDGVSLQSGREGRVIAIFLDEYHIQAGENTARARAALLRFVESELRPTDLVAIMKPLDPLNAIQMTQNRETLRAAVDSLSGRKGDYAPRTPFEQNFMSRAPATADASRAQVVSSALQALALRIGAVRDGRKSVVLVSEGFAPALPRGSDRLTGSVRAIIYAANRYGVAFYPIDPRVPADSNDADHATSALQTLADQTGGEATINRADLETGMSQAAADLDDYYVLTYRAARTGDGTFHPVQVRVKRSDAQVRMRSGYWSANPALLRLALGPTVNPNTMPARLPHSSPLIRPWVGTSRGANGLTNVTVTWEPGLAPPRNQRVGSVILKATADDGRVLFQGPMASRAAFEAAPGQIQLEMTIQSDEGKTLDSDYRGLDVPNLRSGPLQFATAEIVRTRNQREFAAASSRVEVTPVASREFSRAERLLVRAPVYGPDDSPSTVTATLLNRLGSPMRVLSQVPSPPGAPVQFDLPLSSLPPDGYRIELVATGGSQRAASLILFRVTN